MLAPLLLTSTIANSRLNDVEVMHSGRPTLRNDSFLAPLLTGTFGVVNDLGTSGPVVDASHN